MKKLQKRIHKNALDKGFWEGSTSLPEKLALIHSEVSEALEWLRTGDSMLFWDGNKPDGFIPEIADVVIRCLDLVEFLEFDLEEIIEIKMDYNEKREHMHGKLF